MPFLDSVKRFFGIDPSRPQSGTSPNDQYLDPVDRQTLNLEPYHTPSVDDFHIGSDPFFEQGFQQLENLMRSLSIFGFPFGFGPSGPFQPPDPHHDPAGPFRGGLEPESGMFPSHRILGIFVPEVFHQGGFGPGEFHKDGFGPGEFHQGGFGPGQFHKGIFGPTMEESISPRDEVLKPSYRSEIKDVDYDDLVREKGPDVILDMLKKSEEEDRNKERRIVPAPRNEVAPRTFGKFTSTKFSWVNGKSVQEQITSLPDRTFEKRVTTTGPNGETETVISQHTAEEVMPQSRGGLFGGGFRGGFGGPSIW